MAVRQAKHVGVIAVLLLGAAAAGLAVTAPSITAVSPSVVAGYQATTLTIRGEGLAGTSEAWLGSVPLESLVVVSDSEVRGVVPAGTPAGQFRVILRTSAGAETQGTDPITVSAASNGVLSGWRSTEAMLVDRANFGAVVAHGFVFVLGGDDTTDGRSVHRSTINADGSLGTWVIQPAMTTARSNPAVVATGGYLYAIGGVRLSPRSVERASLSPDGTLGAWEATTSLPSAGTGGVTDFLDSVDAVVVGQRVFVVGTTGHSHGRVQTDIATATILADGSLGPWTASTQENLLGLGVRVVAAGGRIYALPSGKVSAVGRDGALGAWQSVSGNSYPTGTAYAAGDGYLYAVGGWRSGNSSFQQVQKARIREDGTLDAWESAATLLEGREGHRAFVSGRVVFALGGEYNGGAPFRRVERSLVGFPTILSASPARRGQPTVVTVRGTNFLSGARVTFGTTPAVEATVVSLEMLTATAPAGLPGTSVDITVENGDGRVATLTGGVVIDGGAPAGVISINGGQSYTGSPAVTLTLAAVDADTAVAQMRFSHDGTTWSALEAYATTRAWTLTAGDGTKDVWVQFLDTAGNESQAVRATIVLDTVAPSGTVALNAGAPATSTRAVTVSLTVADSGSGADTVAFSNDGVTFSTPTAPLSSHAWTISAGDGTKTVSVRLTDRAGNTSTASASILLDTTRPTATVATLSRYQQVAVFVVSWTGVDLTSGIVASELQVRRGAGPWTVAATWASGNSGITTVQGDEGQTYSFRVRAVDGAGNESLLGDDGDTSTTIDTQAPNGGLSINGGALNTTARRVTLTSTAVDAGSGVSRMRVREGAGAWGAWQTYASTQTWEVSDQDGRKVLSAQFADAAGHESDVTTASIVLNTQVPSDFSVSIDSGALFTNSPDVILSLGARAGTAQMQISNDGGFAGAVWEPYVATRAWTITSVGAFVIPRIVYVRFRTLDAAVSSNYQDDIVLDPVPPSGAVAFIGTGATRRISATASDDLSGVHRMVVSSDPSFRGAGWEPFTASRDWPGSDPAPVYARFLDRAGNVSPVVSTTTVVPHAPFGVVDTPIRGENGLQGALAVGGWALDDQSVSAVRVYRECLPLDPDSVCVTVEGQRVVFLGNAAILPGARPDVEATFATNPGARGAGWGFLLLTNMLPNVVAGQSHGGQGTLSLFAFAEDNDGNVALLAPGAISISLDNATIAKPFGAIDTPGQGATVSGVITNFGWVLTPDRNNGPDSTDIVMPSTGAIRVFIDGTAVGAVTYDQCRGTVGTPVPAGQYCDDDVSNIFGGGGPRAPFSVRSSNVSPFRNLDSGRGPIGLFQLDTRTLANGLHTIAWGVVDSAGRTEGIGSRFFTVFNPEAAQDPDVSARLQRRSVADRDAGSEASSTVRMRRGFGSSQPLVVVAPSPDGTYQIDLAIGDRVELDFAGPVDFLPDNRSALPAPPPGATLDEVNGMFRWVVPPGILGTHTLALRRDNQQLLVQITVRPR